MFCKYPCHLSVETPALSVAPEPEDRGKRLAPPVAKQTDKQRAGRTDRKLGQCPSSPCGPQMVKVDVLERDRGQTRAGLTRRRAWLCVSETLGLPMTDGSLETPCHPALAGVPSADDQPWGQREEAGPAAPGGRRGRTLPSGRAVCGTPELHGASLYLQSDS